MNERIVCDGSMARLAEDGTALKRILLCPDGLVKSSNGDFTFNADSYAAIRRQWDARKQAILIDWEHHSLGGDYAAPDGRSPAAGWIEGLEYVPGEGLYGHVKWTDEAAEEIRADKYRYLSPTVMVKKDGRQVIGLDSAALTNKPAIREMPRVAAKQKENSMDWVKQLREMLRPHCPELTDQADETATLAACKSALAELGEQRKTTEHVRSVLALPQAAKGDAIRLALDGRLAAQKSESGELTALKQEVATLKQAEREQRGRAMIDEAVRRNQLKPNDPGFEAFKTFVLKDPEQGKIVIDVLPECPPSGQMVTNSPPPNAGGEDAMIAEAMKEHGGKTFDAYRALQKKILDAPELAAMNKQTAWAEARRKYPKIFGD